MIDVYYWGTPNGLKIKLFLEEAGLPYRIIPVDIGKGEQFRPEFLKIAPNNRIPAIVDQDPRGGGEPISLFESGAILLYLAEKTGRFIPADIRGRALTLQWLFWPEALVRARARAARVPASLCRGRAVLQPQDGRRGAQDPVRTDRYVTPRLKTARAANRPRRSAPIVAAGSRRSRRRSIRAAASCRRAVECVPRRAPG